MNDYNLKTRAIESFCVVLFSVGYSLIANAEILTELLTDTIK